ncbi:putative esterase [Gillisia sp. Hel_I_86]|uniref:alpha/beta hydrolase n=1 Tax=Gillisia sp. Hel_I_86 TaxID=1249981 RepID=UPI00119AF70F|nr:esterase [Gillisia sp. Hel_I_86]TVZ25259.1 putative esterase [Gillisia sp. Hel_I_86]
MNPTEKQVSYKITNTYATLNERTSKTKNVWVVFHGIGYLSTYFLKYFKGLNPEENYIVAPQAASKYYLNGKYTHVGASWFTKEKTQQEVENALNYLDEVVKAEDLDTATNLIVLGYSQGVSVVTRWISRRKIQCSQLILCSGGLPKELESQDFQYMEETKVSMIYGKNDPYMDDERLKNEKIHATKLFPNNLSVIPFEGVHEMKPSIIESLV